MKKVAIVYHYIALYRLPVFQELMKSVDVEYTIYSGKDSEFEIKKVDESFSDVDISEGGLRWKFLKNRWLLKKKFLWQSGLLDMVLKKEYDSYIFLGSSFHISTWLAVIIVRLKRKKAYFWMHGVYRDKLKLFDYIKIFIFYKLVNGYFLYGNRAKNILEKYNKSTKKGIYVIYNSLDYNKSLNLRVLNIKEDDIFNFRKNYFKTNDYPIVCFIGRINSIKRIDLLIEAQKIIFEKFKESLFNIIIIGDGEQLLALNKLVDKYHLTENVSFVGALYEEEKIANILSYSDICVTPGEVGLTAIHAMSYGTPVISHNEFNIQMPEVEVIKAGISGDFFDYGDVNDLVLKLVNWFKMYPIKNEVVSHNCMEIIDDYYNPEYQLKVFDSVLIK